MHPARNRDSGRLTPPAGRERSERFRQPALYAIDCLSQIGPAVAPAPLQHRRLALRPVRQRTANDRLRDPLIRVNALAGVKEAQPGVRDRRHAIPGNEDQVFVGGRIEGKVSPPD
jgi:hypothetical protein